MSFKDSKAQILANSASDDSDISTMEADLATKTRVETVEGKVKAIEDDLAVEKPKIAKNATDIAALQGLVGDGYEAIPSEKIQALFKVTE